MKSKRIILATVILALAALACQTLLPTTEPSAIPTQPQQAPPPQSQNNNAPQTEDDVPRISIEEARAAVDSGQAVLVDVRRVESYNESHAQGAISIPLEQFEANIASVPLEKDQWIITYCT